MKYLFLKGFGIFTLILSLASCGIQKNPRMETNEELAGWIKDKNFDFSADFAYPTNSYAVTQVMSRLMSPGNGTGMINLIGNPNYLRMRGDGVSASLPFYGERRMGGGFGQDTGVDFDGAYTEYSESYDEKKQRYTLKFNTRKDSESYQVSLTVFLNGTATLNVISVSRTTIQYTGKLTEVAAKKETSTE